MKKDKDEEKQQEILRKHEQLQSETDKDCHSQQ